MKLNPPYFVAEISANHCGEFKTAKKLIKTAKINEVINDMPPERGISFL